jgi:hypothetical protein
VDLHRETQSDSLVAILFSHWEAPDRPRRHWNPKGWRAGLARFHKRNPLLFAVIASLCPLTWLDGFLRPFTEGRGGVFMLVYVCIWPAIALIDRRDRRRREVVDA